MKTKIFAYRDHLGINADLDKGIFINNPKAIGQLGMVINIEQIEITKEAKELIKKANYCNETLSELMLSRHNDGSASIGIMGFNKVIFSPENIVVGCACDKGILDDMPDVEIRLDEEFERVIDEKLDKESDEN